jgi:hypothetical protein
VNEWVARTRRSETARELRKILKDARPFNDFMTALKEPDKAELFVPAARPGLPPVARAPRLWSQGTASDSWSSRQLRRRATSPSRSPSTGDSGSHDSYPDHSSFS